MTKAKAREIVKGLNLKTVEQVSRSNDVGVSIGYLEAIEKAEGFKELKEQFRECRRNRAGDGICCGCADRFFEVLAKWEKEK